MTNNKPTKIPWNKGKTGIYSKELLEHWSQIRLGKKKSVESNKKRSQTQTGRKDPENTIKNKKNAGCLIWKNMLPEIREKRIIQAKNQMMKLCQNNIGTTKSEATRKKQSQSGKGKHCHNGEKNPNWKGGLSFFPYSKDWTKEKKEEIKMRDDYLCQNPNCSGEKIKRITVHHINYDKNNCENTNLITLCVQCNSKSNHNREFWKILYTYIIRRKYDILPFTCA